MNKQREFGFMDGGNEKGLEVNKEPNDEKEVTDQETPNLVEMYEAELERRKGLTQDQRDEEDRKFRQEREAETRKHNEELNAGREKKKAKKKKPSRTPGKKEIFADRQSAAAGDNTLFEDE